MSKKILGFILCLIGCCVPVVAIFVNRSLSTTEGESLSVAMSAIMLTIGFIAVGCGLIGSEFNS